jgi:peroxiredoxin
MSRLVKFLAFGAAAVLAVSCGRSAKIDAVVSGLSSSDVVVKVLNVNKFEVLDTVATDAAGKLSYKVDIEKGQPEFVYLFHNDVKIASLILQGGDKVVVDADTLGNYTVTGSEESLKLAQVEREHAAVLSRMSAMVQASNESSDKAALEKLRKELGQEYIAYYRNCVKYVMENSHSLSVVPVFYQNLADNLPVFSQSTDAIIFKNVADSLEIAYPDSKYAKALRTEAEKRMQYLEFEAKLINAQQISFPEIELPDLQAQKRKLSEVDAKVIMVYFWSASNADQKMFNLDMLKPVYEDFHGKGFEIYQVSLDADKGLWARVVKEQGLPWINVCDTRSAASPYAVAYNLPALPAAFIIADGELVDGKVVDEASLRKLLKKLL